MSKIHQDTIRAAFAADHAAAPATVLAAATALGPEGVKAAAIDQAPKVGRKAKAATDWARQVSTAAALLVLVQDAAEDKDAAAVSCITRAKASAATVKANGCKATGSGDTLVGKVSRMVEEGGPKKALADIRKASTKGAPRAPKDPTATPALVKSIQTKVASFEKAYTDQSPTVEAKAQELMQALRLLQKHEAKIDGALVKIALLPEVAVGE